MIEIWRDIKEYEGLYQISNLGRVKSLSRCYWHGNRWYKQKEKFLKLNINTKGYQSVVLYDAEHKSKRVMIHRLVANAFISNPDNLPEVNHRDENKENNQVDNLEWCTSEYNNNYGTKSARLSIKMSGRKQPVEINLKRSQTMREHIAIRKANGTYWK